MRNMDWVMVGALIAGTFCAGNDVYAGVHVAFGVIAAAMVCRIAGAAIEYLDGK